VNACVASAMPVVAMTMLQAAAATGTASVGPRNSVTDELHRRLSRVAEFGGQAKSAVRRADRPRYDAGRGGR
jgi:hypothetical protein